MSAHVCHEFSWSQNYSWYLSCIELNSVDIFNLPLFVFLSDWISADQCHKSIVTKFDPRGWKVRTS